MKKITLLIGLLYFCFSSVAYAEGKTMECGDRDETLPYGYYKITFDLSSADAEMQWRARYEKDGEIVSGCKYKDCRIEIAPLQVLPTTLRFRWPEMGGVYEATMDVNRQDLSYELKSRRARTGDISAGSPGVCKLVEADTSKNKI